MIPDFKNLLTAFLSKDGAGVLGTVGKKMSRSAIPLPSEAIGMQMAEGMHQAARENTPQALPDHQTVTKTSTPWAQTNVGKGTMGVLGNVSNTLNQMVSQPMQTGNVLMDTGEEAQNAIARYMPKYAKGGVIPVGGMGIVGDGTNDPNAQEVVQVLPNGQGAVVTPLADEPIQTVVQNRPLEAMPMPPKLPIYASDENIPVDINDNNPVLSPDEQALNQMRDQVKEASQIQTGKWKNIGYGTLQGIANAITGTNKPIQTYDEVKRDRRVRQLAPQLQMLEDKVKFQRDKEKDILTAENIRADNERLNLIVKNTQTAKADAEKGKALKTIVGLKWIDPKNSTHIAMLQRAGIAPSTVEGYDDRKRDMKQVAGIWYRDNGKGQFEQTNIPLDESKALVDYKVEMPTGEIRTFKVANKDAANFATQMHALGLRLEQQDRQFTTREENDKTRQQIEIEARAALERLKAELRDTSKMKEADRKKKESQKKELELILDAKGEAIPNQ